MKRKQIQKNEPLRDVFATQGILVLLIGIVIYGLHLFAPEFCGALLREWHSAAEKSPSLEALGAQAAAWFAAIFAG